jgi:hypothetical protein
VVAKQSREAWFQYRAVAGARLRKWNSVPASNIARTELDGSCAVIDRAYSSEGSTFSTVGSIEGIRTVPPPPWVRE